MKKFLRVVYNIGFVLLHCVGLLFVEAFGAVKWLDLVPGDWTIWQDLLLVMVVIVLLTIHYVLIRYMARPSLYIVTAFEAVVTLAVSAFLIFAPSWFFGEPIVSAHIFVVIIQLVILSARGISWYFLIKKRRDKSTN